MELKLESIVDGQPKTDIHEIHPASELGVIVTSNGWPEVIMKNFKAYTIQEWSDSYAVYQLTSSFHIP